MKKPMVISFSVIFTCIFSLFFIKVSMQRGSGGNAKKSIIHLVALAGCEP